MCNVEISTSLKYNLLAERTPESSDPITVRREEPLSLCNTSGMPSKKKKKHVNHEFLFEIISMWLDNLGFCTEASLRCSYILNKASLRTERTNWEWNGKSHQDCNGVSASSDHHSGVLKDLRHTRKAAETYSVWRKDMTKFLLKTRQDVQNIRRIVEIWIDSTQRYTTLVST